MKTTIKFLTCYIMAMTITTLVCCKKDDLEDAVLPPVAQGQLDTSGTNGTDGADGADGAQGEQGPKGEQGPAGDEGTQGETGPSGPQGEQGQDGINGATGPQGPKGDPGDAGIQGPKGEDGNANVIVSDWFEPKESSFSVNNPRYKVMPLAESIKSRIKDGIILVYYDDDLQIEPLSQYLFDTSGNITKSIDSHINHASNTLYITISKYGSDLTPREYLWDSSGAPYNKGVRFRYVIVPPSGASSKNNGFDFKKMTYKQVMEHLGLIY